jgi:hypothetical protein
LIKYLKRSLTDKQVGAEELEKGIWKVFYKNIFLGYFNEKLL